MTVLCVLGGAPDRCPPQLETGIALAKTLGSPLTGLLALPDPANAAMYLVSAESMMAGATGVSAVEEAQKDMRASISETFEQCVADAGTWLSAELKHETGPTHAVAAAHAILSECAVFPRAAAQSGHPLNPVYEYALMEERLPAILAAESGEIGGPTVIAWDGSPRSMRAVRAHLPLIQAFGEAVIAVNPDKSSDAAAVATPEALSDWLHAQRVTTKIERFDGKISAGLLDIAKAHKAGLIVMGAYGHSRIGQMLFGGTSRALMHAEDGPALALAH